MPCPTEPPCPTPSNALSLSWCCRPEFYQTIDAEIAAGLGGGGGLVVIANPLRALFEVEFGTSWETWKDAFINGRGILENAEATGGGSVLYLWQPPRDAYLELYALRLAGCKPRTGITMDCRPAIGYP